MADVFISYCRSQRERVALIEEKLQALGLTVWLDKSLSIGGSFGDEITQQIDGARAVLVCWEKDANQSQWVFREATHALTLNKLVPCMLESVDLRPPFDSIHAEDLSAWEGEDAFAAWIKVLERIGELVGRLGLEEYAQILGEGAPARSLRDWLSKFGDDPLAPQVRERIAVLDHESAKERLRRERREEIERERKRRAARRRFNRAKTPKSERAAARAGMAGLFVIAGAVLVAIGVAAYGAQEVTKQASAEIQRSAFETRRNSNIQDNRIAATEQRMRDMGRRLRAAESGAANRSAASVESALAAAQHYISHGELSLDNERIIESAAATPFGDEASQSTELALRGVAELMLWGRGAESIPNHAVGLPSRLQRAREAFDIAAQDPALASLAHAGNAWVQFQWTASVASNYAPADCQRLADYVEASADGGPVGPLPLYWKAQCERKTGRLNEALQSYAAALAIVAPGASQSERSFGELTLVMNAFHGVGTTLISHRVAENDPNVAASMALARRYCPIPANATGSPRMRLAEACLRMAISFRERLEQTDNQISGTAENIGFVYLRDRQFDRAFAHAQEVERTGIFAWNELIRALAASHASDRSTRDVLAVKRVALLNISFFDVGEFAVCELEVLLEPELYREAIRIIRQQHPGQDVACAAS